MLRNLLTRPLATWIKQHLILPLSRRLGSTLGGAALGLELTASQIGAIETAFVVGGGILIDLTLSFTDRKAGI